MKQLLSKILMMLVFAAMVLPSQAQLLKVIVIDKALRAQTSIPWQKALQFDDKGVAVLENPEITEPRSSGYVIPMPLMADMLSAKNEFNQVRQ